MNTIAERCMKVISKSLGVSLDKVTPEKNFIEDLGADSLDVVEIVISIEEEFKILVDEEDAELISTVQSAIDYLEKKLK
jgi:acyl carrier protein